MTTAIVVAVFAAIVATDYIPLLKRTETKVKFVYGAVMLVSFSVLILHTLDIAVPSPSAPIRDLIDALFPKLNP